MLPVGPMGWSTSTCWRARGRRPTALVSIMAVNNEIGVVQPLAEIGASARARRRAVPHRRGAGGSARSPLDVEAMKIDLLSHLRPQDLRAQGHRRALCPAPAAGAAGAAVRRRRAGARPALRHAAGAALRRAGRGRANSPAREMAAEAARLRRAARPALSLADGGAAGARGQRRSGSARLPGNLNIGFARRSTALDADGGGAGAVAVARIGLHLGRRSSRPMCCARSGSTPTAGASLRIGLGRFTTEAELLARSTGSMRRWLACAPRACSPCWNAPHNIPDLGTADGVLASVRQVRRGRQWHGSRR